MRFDHPIAWTHRPYFSRAFYTALGDSTESWANPLLLDHVMGGIAWAAEAGPAHPPKEIHDSRARFLCEQHGREAEARRLTAQDDGAAALDSSFQKDALYSFQQGEQPMDLAILPDGRVLVAVRNGALLMLKPNLNTVILAGRWNVTNSNEDGLLGIAVDPSFPTTGWIYVYYSPIAQTNPTQNRLSRYTMRGDAVDLTTEVKMISITTQRLACCHSGGDIKFDAKGNLLLSVGDNTYQIGWAPTDDRPGFSVLDSQKSASNTNDLRGKLLRITPNATNYTIPANNLFTADATHKGEIYAMGLRNPFRFAVDLLTNDVYWGEIGPDELASDLTRGPIGMDEINKIPYNDPGNYGWPYCLGPNLPYVKYDYTTQTSLNISYNCSNPENNSPNNSGQKTGLPSSRAALAYYTYNNSTDFPEFDAEDPTLVLGRAAIAPSFYRYGLSCNASAPYALPQFFDNTLFFFDWFRDTSRLLQFDSSGKLLKIAQSWPGFKFNSVMDMEIAPDGSLYFVEFGAGFTLTGAQLSRMRYLGAPNPITCQVTASATTGVIPLAVQFSADASKSSDNLTLSYSWDFYTNGTVGSTAANPTFTYTKEGVAVATLTLKTSKASKTCTVPIDIQSNLNTPPEVSVDYPFEGGIYTWGDVAYFSVSVTDKEDGSTADGGVPCSNLQVTPGLGHCPGHLAPCHVHNSVANYACNGTVGPTEDEHSWEKFYYFIQALYPDRGGANGSAPITSLTFRQLKPSVWQSEFFDAVSSVDNGTTQTTTDKIGGGVDVVGLSNGDWLRYDNFNLMNIDSVTFRGYSVSGALIDLRIGSPTGRVIATATIAPTNAGTYNDTTVPVLDTNQWFLVDMQAAYTVSRVQLDPGPWPMDFIRGFGLYASTDNATWGTPFVPLVMGHPPTPTYINSSVSKNFTGLLDIPINPPVTARYLKVFNIGPAANTSWWSIAEFRAFDTKNVSLGTANWTAQASTSNFDAPPKGALDGNLTSRWSSGEAQRPGNVSLYTVFRSTTSSANLDVAAPASAPAASALRSINLLTLNYMTFNGQGLSSTPHDIGAKPPVSAHY
eukprot:TRINITY_DN11285_c0_g1_i5.p1 TRINITY_DN11285_c0_g1~~TRINITY_DN11285_c0_g1_i5.p1  ORF type:complete len:1063 (+),score=165.00 TRINITY_DN11285_c0_g1_i5:961-4149(+)